MERMESKMLDMLERKYSLAARALHKKDYENVIEKVFDFLNSRELSLGNSIC